MVIEAAAAAAAAASHHHHQHYQHTNSKNASALTSASAAVGDTDEDDGGGIEGGCAGSGDEGEEVLHGDKSMRIFRAHSAILKARAPYIRCMLSTNMQEAASLDIVETEIEPVVFEQLLRWCYTDSVTEGALEAMGEYLLLASNKYCCEALKQI